MHVTIEDDEEIESNDAVKEIETKGTKASRVSKDKSSGEEKLRK